MDVPGPELALDEIGNGRALDKPGQHQALFSKARSHVQNVALGAGGLEIKQIAVLHRHAVFRGDAHAHGGEGGNGIFLFHIDTPFRRAA